jgi:tetraacyldisaccharide 4'-kinase
MSQQNQSSSLLPPALRWAGPPLALGYGLGGKIHRALTTPQVAPLPAICIGNITVGGTGKTPATKYFARGLAQRNRKPAVLMRGYKGQASDEAVEVQHALSDLHTPVLVGADRLASARRAKEQGCDCVLLDDGFQHWKLARDLDIVLIDATDPFGGGHLAPWGKLREAPEGLARAGVVILTRSDMVSKGERESLRKEIARLAPNATLAVAAHVPAVLREFKENGADYYPEKLKGLNICAACAIGNPNGFFKTLETLGAKLLKTWAYPDHSDFSAWQADRVIETAAKMKAAAIVVTEKDAPKLLRHIRGDEFPVWVLDVRFGVTEGEAAVWTRVQQVLAAATNRLSR